MKKKSFRLLSALTLLTPSMLLSVTSTWQGGSGPLWSTNANWITPPVSGNDLVFPAIGVNVTSFDDIANLSTTSMTVTDNVNYAIGGGVDTLTFSALGSTLTFNQPAALGAHMLSGFVMSVGAGADLTITNYGPNACTIANPIQGAGRQVAVAGGNSLGEILIFSGPNSYGSTAIGNGVVLQVSADNNLGGASSPVTFTGTIVPGILSFTSGFTTSRSYVSGSASAPIDLSLSSPGITMTLTGDLGGGSGGLQFQSADAAGTLVLAKGSPNTFTGNTVINGPGTLQVSIDGHLGASPGAIILAGGTFQPTASFTTQRPITLNAAAPPPNPMIRVSPGVILTHDNTTNIISGPAGLSIGGGGTVALTGPSTNNYGGNTTVNTSTLQVSGDNVLGASTSNLVLSQATLHATGNVTTSRGITLNTGPSTINVDVGLSLTQDNTTHIFNATAGLVKTGLGSLTLTGPQTNTFTSGITVSSGALIGDTNTLQGSITDNSTLIFAQNITGTYASSISGTGQMRMTGAGTLNLSASNTYQGGTLLQNGTLALVGPGSLFSGGSLLFSGSAIFDISGAAAPIVVGALDGTGGGSQIVLGSNQLITNTPLSVTYGGAISGIGGQIDKQGSGTWILTGTNSYTGGTTVGGGTLQGDTHSLQGNITNNATVIFNQTFDDTYAGAMSGSGMMVKLGSGLLNMTGSSNYAGPTALMAGTLAINGSLMTSSVIVAPTTTLKGTGTITGTVNNSGTLMPGNSIGTLNIVGDVIFNAGSIYVVELNPTQSSLLNITGNLTIHPDTLQIFPFSGNYTAGSEYTIIKTTGTINGTFANVINSLPLINFTVLYFPNHIDLVLAITNFSQVVTTGNPGKVAKSLQGVTPPPGSDLAFVYQQLFLLNTSQLYAAFNQMQPSLTIGLTLAQQNNFNLVTSALRKRTRALHETRCFPSQSCPSKNPVPMEQSWFPKPRQSSDTEKNNCKKQGEHWNIWADASLGFYRQGSGNQNFGFHSDSIVGATGLDYRFPSNLYLGILGAYTYTDIDWSRSQANGNINSYYGGLYSSWLNKYCFVNLSAIGSFNNYGNSRKISFGLIDRHAQARHDGAGVESHLDFGFLTPQHSRFQFAPFGQLDHVYLHQKRYTEHDAKSLNLHVHKYNANLLRSELGMQGRYCIRSRVGSVIPSLKLSWVREVRFNGKHLTSRLVSSPHSFIVSGLYPNRSLIAPGAAMTAVFLDDRLNASLTYEGEFGHKVRNNTANLTLMWAF